MLAEVAPLAPAVPAIGGLLLILAFLVLIALQQAWGATLGFLFNKLADLLDKVSFAGHHLLGPVSSGLRAVSHNVWVALGRAALASEKGAVYLFHQAGVMLFWIGHEIKALATDTATVTDRIIRVEIPHAVHGSTAALERKLHGIDRLPARIEAQVKAQLARLQHGIDRLLRDAIRTTHTVARGIDATVTGALHRVSGLGKRLSRVEGKLAAGAFAAAVAVALARLGLRWLRCGNLKRAGKQVCAIDTNLFEALLGEALLVASALSLREFARELEEPVKLTMDGLHSIVREL